jgi:hypothetical protein
MGKPTGQILESPTNRMESSNRVHRREMVVVARDRVQIRGFVKHCLKLLFVSTVPVRCLTRLASSLE